MRWLRIKLDRIVAEHHGGLRHLADLVAPLGLGNIDVGVVGGEAAHPVGEMQASGAEMDRLIWISAATTITPAITMASRMSQNA